MNRMLIALNTQRHALPNGQMLLDAALMVNACNKTNVTRSFFRSVNYDTQTHQQRIGLLLILVALIQYGLSIRQLD